MVRDRLSLTERADRLMQLHRKWKPIEVRYEQYGLQADIEHIKDRMERENYRFTIKEVGGRVAKADRIKRLVPLFEQNRLWLPGALYATNREGRSENLVEVFIEQEYLAFPVSAHDDMLDALARIAEPEMPLKWPTKQERRVIAPARFSSHSPGTGM
jgi:phage terminase large subunit-like protein